MAAEIIARLPASFEKAKESGDLLFFPSTIEPHMDPCGLEVRLQEAACALHR